MSDVASSHEYIEKKYELTERNVITVLEGTERPGFTVIEVDGHIDNDFGQGEYHHEKVIEVYEEETLAVERARILEETKGNEHHSNASGDGVVMWYTHYKTGHATLHLCMVESPEVK